MNILFILAVERYFKELKTGIDPGIITSVILKPIDTGLVSWRELSFTEEDLKHEAKLAWIRLEEKLFRDLKTCLSVGLIVSRILHPIDTDLISWRELSFTEEDLKHEAKLAWVRYVEYQYEAFRSKMDARVMSAKIRYPISAGLVSWENLSFTEAYLIQKERAFCT